MIILKVIGGLGNQMFEIAFARVLSLEFDEKIYLDLSVYKKYKIRCFSVLNLKVSDFIGYIEDTKLPIFKHLYLKLSQKIYHVYQKVVKLVTKSDRIGKKPYDILTKGGLYYNFDVYYYQTSKSNREIKCLYGYFQSEKYFEKYKQQITEDLKVKIPPTDREKKLLEEIKSCNAVGVSMRLGDDYVKSSLLNVCTEDFYYKGMDYIYNKNKDVVFYIFSDDIDRAKKQFKFKYPVRYVDGFKDYESLRLMYSCKNFVISNSSFSWWGAYLSSNPDKIIVAPSKWYNNSKEKSDIYLDDMILIDV